MGNKILENIAILKLKNYVRKADPDQNYWFDFAKSRIDEYISSFGDNFYLIIYGDPDVEDDFFVLPFSAFKHVFSDAHIAQDGRNRWIGSIKFNELRVTNSKLRPDISAYYANATLLNRELPKPILVSLSSEEDRNDYAIENRRIEIKVRQKQSLFRNRVLSNFGQKCCLTGIDESDLLVASHIVPWAKGKSSRLDPHNGLCLFITYDGLFDEGYFSLSEDLSVIITPRAENLSPKLKQLLIEIDGQKIEKPVRYQINPQYVHFHREYIFKS